MVSKSLGVADTRLECQDPTSHQDPAQMRKATRMFRRLFLSIFPALVEKLFPSSPAPISTVSNARSHMVQLLYADSVMPPTDWLQRFPDVVPVKDGYETDAQGPD